VRKNKVGLGKTLRWRSFFRKSFDGKTFYTRGFHSYNRIQHSCFQILRACKIIWKWCVRITQLKN